MSHVESGSENFNSMDEEKEADEDSNDFVAGSHSKTATKNLRGSSKGNLRKQPSYYLKNQHLMEDESSEHQKHEALWMGDDRLIRKMQEYTEEQFGKTIGRTKAKSVFKKIFGKEVNREEERTKIMEKYIKHNLSKEQRKMMKDEIREAKKRAEEDKSDKSDPIFDITKGFLKQEHGTCR